MKKDKSTLVFDFIAVGQQVLNIERNGLAQLDQYINDDFTRVCNLLFYCSGKVVIMGVGKSGHIGRKLASTFASTGTPSFFIHPGEASHGDLGMLSLQDIVFVLSNSGESNEILVLIPYFKKLDIPIVCITSKIDSTIGKAANICLCVHVPEEACSLGLVPSSSTTASLVMGDAIAIALLKARGFTASDFAFSHPGGVLGQKLLLDSKDCCLYA